MEVVFAKKSEMFKLVYIVERDKGYRNVYLLRLFYLYICIERLFE